MSVETVGVDELRAHVRVTGDIDMSTGAPLWAVLEGHLASGRRFLRLDLAGVTFLDASALSGISRMHRAALARGGSLLLISVPSPIARLLRLTGLDDVLFFAGPSAAERSAEPITDDAGAATVWPARPVPRTPPGARGATRQPHGKGG